MVPVNDPPSCATAQLNASQLGGPPNHQFVNLSVSGFTDLDGNPITVTATSVFQDEPVNGGGDGNTSPDAILSPLQVRRERSGQGDGRIYHITFGATDGAGGSCQVTLKVCVPHDKGNKVQCVDGGPLYNSTQQ